MKDISSLLDDCLTWDQVASQTQDQTGHNAFNNIMGNLWDLPMFAASPGSQLIAFENSKVGPEQ